MLATFHGQQHVQVIFRRGDAVDAGNARHDNGVAPREQRACGGEAEPLNFLINRGVLLDVGVGARNVSFRLIIIEVADKIFDRIARKKLFELRIQLRGEGFVVRNDERGAVEFSNYIRDRKSFA